MKGISTIGDTYDQYRHNTSNCDPTVRSQKTLSSTMKRQVGHSVKKYKDELKETKKRLK